MFDAFLAQVSLLQHHTVHLCAHAVLTMQLPHIDEVKRPELLERLTQESVDGDQGNWEAGAQSNFMIAAGRLGLRVASAANIGDDVYGHWLADVLKVLQNAPHGPPGSKVLCLESQAFSAEQNLCRGSQGCNVHSEWDVLNEGWSKAGLLVIVQSVFVEAFTLSSVT